MPVWTLNPISLVLLFFIFFTANDFFFLPVLLFISQYVIQQLTQLMVFICFLCTKWNIGGFSGVCCLSACATCIAELLAENGFHYFLLTRVFVICLLHWTILLICFEHKQSFIQKLVLKVCFIFILLLPWVFIMVLNGW